MAIVVKSDFWNDSLTLVNSNATGRKRIARLLNQYSLRKDRELMTELLGAAAGEAASSTRKRVAHSTTQLGGVRTIETETQVSRVTAAADDTDLTANYLTYRSQPSSYPVDKATLP